MGWESAGRPATAGLTGTRHWRSASQGTDCYPRLQKVLPVYLSRAKEGLVKNQEIEWKATLKGHERDVFLSSGDFA